MRKTPAKVHPHYVLAEPFVKTTSVSATLVNFRYTAQHGQSFESRNDSKALSDSLNIFLTPTVCPGEPTDRLVEGFPVGH